MIHEPPLLHRCSPPRYRPKNEWPTHAAPPGWTKNPKARFPIPTGYRPGTVWVCACGRGWLRRPGQHYGRNAYRGHSEGTWSPVPWYAFRIRRRIREYEERCAYERAKAIVDSYVLPTSG